jgi:hypothetical protein
MWQGLVGFLPDRLPVDNLPVPATVESWADDLTKVAGAGVLNKHTWSNTMGETEGTARYASG